MERVRQELEAFEERIAQKFNVDEKSVRALVKAFVGQEFAKLHSVVMEEIARVRAEFEERLARLGLDAEAIRRVIDEVQSRLLSELDRRFMHMLDAINEVSNVNRDVLDIVNEVLKLEAESKERIEKLESLLDEERLEELLYRALIRRGVIRQRRRRWAPLIAGLSVLAAIIAGFIINPIATLVILFIAIVILLRW